MLSLEHKIFDNRKYFIESFIKIRDKNKRIIPLQFNDVQNSLYYLKLKHKITRRNILKARQVGVSTYTLSDYLVDTITNEGTHTKLVTHKQTASEEFLVTIKEMYDSIPSELKPAIKGTEGRGKRGRDNIRVLSFPELGSKITIDWCGDIGRSETINNLHCCVHKDGLIILSDGSTKTIEKIQIGDKIITSSGEIAEVNNKFYTGKKQTYNIQTWYSNEKLPLTKEHKVLTDKGWKKCDDLTTNDWIALPKIKLTNEIKEYTYNLPNLPRQQGGGTKHIENYTVKLDYDFGYYLAEGHITKQYKTNRYNAVVFGYHKDETFIENAYKFAKTLCGKRRDDTFKNYNGKLTTLQGTFLAHLTESICGRVENKHIPEWFFKTNKIFISGVLKGYLDGDGSKNRKDLINVMSIHEKISRQIKRLYIGLENTLVSLRYNKNVKRYDKPTKPNYSINYFTPKTNKQRKFKIINDIIYVKIKLIEPYEINDVYDITVNHKDHCFETPIGIISNSELAFWKNAKDVMKGLLPSVPDDGDITYESTPNGVGGLFHSNYKKGKRGEGKFRSFFYQWWWDSNYCVANPTIDIKTLTEEEIYLISKYNLSPGQIQWRREKIEEMDGDIWAFKQEYPEDDTECFIQSGVRPYDSRHLMYDLPPEEHYIEGHRYVIGVDTSEGKPHSTPSSICVIDRHTQRQVKLLEGLYKPDNLAKKALEIAISYGAPIGACLVMIERNNHGHKVISKFIDYARIKGIPYAKILYKAQDDDYGWLTTGASRSLMLDDLEEAIRYAYEGKPDGLIITSEILRDELLAADIDEKGRIVKGDGFNLDSVIATAIAWQGVLYGKIRRISDNKDYKFEIPNGSVDYHGRVTDNWDAVDDNDWADPVAEYMKAGNW